MDQKYIENLYSDLEKIRKFCLENGAKLAVAESVSSGMLQVLFSTMEEAGLFFCGGITTYSCEMKAKLLDISREKCESCLGVNQEITDIMAKNVCTLMSADLGVALTGFASPIPEERIYERIAFGSICCRGEIIWGGSFNSMKDQQYEAQLDFAEKMIVAFSSSLPMLEDRIKSG